MRRTYILLILIAIIMLSMLAACKKTTTTEFTVDRSACNGCGRCQQFGPTDAIEFNNDGKAVIDQTLCQQDGLCVSACPQNAIY
jgi:NAD-dependent dihydropyrimidine dehydrogenase PreA subunit